MATSQPNQAMLNGPAGKPPAGVTPDFSGQTQVLIIITVVVYLLFTALAILMRFYTKLFLIRSVAYEDSNRLCAHFMHHSYTNACQTPLRCCQSGIWFLLRVLDMLNGTDFTIWVHHSPSNQKPYLERSIERYLLNATCILWYEIAARQNRKLTAGVVVEYRCNNLLSRPFFRQAFDSSTISSNFPSYTTGKYVSLRWSSNLHLGYLFVLFRSEDFLNYYVHSAWENLASIFDQGPMLQLQRQLSILWDI